MPTQVKRQALSKKAKAAILTYVLYFGERKGQYLHVLVEYTLKAERMDREKLYQWLDEHGYRWRPRYEKWMK